MATETRQEWSESLDERDTRTDSENAKSKEQQKREGEGVEREERENMIESGIVFVFGLFCWFYKYFTIIVVMFASVDANWLCMYMYTRLKFN